MLCVDGVEFSFDEKILRGISFEAERGDLISILGPNGSGKTTLLRCISAALKPQRGSVYIDGNSVHALKSRDVAKRFAFVEQGSPTGYDLSVRDIVMLGRLPQIKRFSLPSEDDRLKVEKALSMVGVGDLAERRFDEISGGEKQKALIALALVQDADILLMDEPISNLDIRAQLDIMKLLRTLCAEGKLVIVTTHNVSLAAHFSDRILLLKEGRQVAFGTPGIVISDELMREVFGVGLSIAGEIRSSSKKRGKVHVICGGGTGASLLERLYDFELSTGVLNLFDSDHEKAVELGADIAEEAPFAPISDPAFERNMELIERADLIIVTGFPVGHGNMRNIEAALEARRRGKEVIVYGRCEDFTGGKAGPLIEELERAGRPFTEEGALLEFIHSR
jgi:iron complex transport system ATP-binding protein